MPEEIMSEKSPSRPARILALVAALGVLLLPGIAGGVMCADVAPGNCPDVVIGEGEDRLALPCTKPLADYQEELYLWVNERRYVDLGWPRDEHVRDTGPFVLGENYGTHPAVRIHYSPEVAAWLEDGRRGELPAGSMIIKEMFLPPAARLEDRRGDFEDASEWEALVEASVANWAIMIKDCQTYDGWFWAGTSAYSRVGLTGDEYVDKVHSTVDTNDYPFAFRESDTGLAPCLRCHAVAESESTFSAIGNLDGEQLRFRVDESWRTPPSSEAKLTAVGGQLVYLNQVFPGQALPPEQRPAGGEGEVALLQSVFHGDSSAADATPDGDELLSQPLSSPSASFTEYFQLGGRANGAELTAADFAASPASGPTTCPPLRRGPSNSSPRTTAWVAMAASAARPTA